MPLLPRSTLFPYTTFFRSDPRSPGKAANLHTTRLDRDALIEVVTCGRVGTEMPYFDKYAYEERKCRGLSEADLGKDMPRSEEHTSELQSRQYLVCRLLLEK